MDVLEDTPAEAPPRDLTEDQVDTLLRQAEVRLLAQSSSSSRSPAKTRPASDLPRPYIDFKHGIARPDTQRLLSDDDRALASGVRRIEDPIAAKRRHIEEKKATAGAQWYNLPRTVLTSELKRDLQLLRMRSVLDPHRHYKKESAKAKVPEFSQLGTLIEGPTEWFNGRLNKKNRKRTLAEEVMEGERESGRLKSKYDEVQSKKRSGKRGEYNKRMEKRYGKHYKK